MNILVLPENVETTLEIEEIDHSSVWNLIDELNKLEDIDNVLIKISEDDVQKLAVNEQFIDGHLQILRIFGVDYPPAFDVGNNWDNITQETIESVEKSTKEKKKRDKANSKEDIPVKSTDELLNDVFQKGKLEDVPVAGQSLSQEKVVTEED